MSSTKYTEYDAYAADAAAEGTVYDVNGQDWDQVVAGCRGRRRRAARGQHGPAAPVHARGAAADPHPRRRDGGRVPGRHRLPAHRHREEHGVPHLDAGHHVLHPDGLPGADLQRDGVLPRRGEAARRHRPDPRAGPDHPGDDDGAQPDLLAPGRDRHVRPGARRDDGDAQRVHRARVHPRPVRGDHRAADEHGLRPAGRRRAGPAERDAQQGARLPGPDAEAVPGDAQAAGLQPGLPGQDQGRRVPRPHRLHGARRHRAGAARDRAAVGPAQVAALLRLRDLRLRGRHRGDRRRLRPLSRSDEGDGGVPEDRRAVRGAAPDGQGPGDDRGQEDRLARAAGHRGGRDGQLAPAHRAHHGHLDGGPHPPLQAGDRGVPGAAWGRSTRRSSAARRARRAPGERRRHPPVPGALPRPVLRQPAGDAGDGGGRHGRRRHRGRGQHRPGHGGVDR